VPLQFLCLALYDCVLVHIMNTLRTDASWQGIKQEMTNSMAKRKLATTLNIFRESYKEADIMCIQKCSTIYRNSLESAMGMEFDIIFPDHMDYEDPTAAASIILLRKKLFNGYAHKNLTSEVIELVEAQKAGKQPGANELLVISTKGKDGKPYLIASFHSDSKGKQSIPVVKALSMVLKKENESAETRAIFGLDANTVLDNVIKFSEECKSVGLRTVTGPHYAAWTTTCKARTHLQPQTTKAVPMSMRLYDDCNPRDHILIDRKAFDVKKMLRDNTGKKDFIEAQNIPSMDFPSDHAIICATLEPRAEEEAQVDDAKLDELREKLLMAMEDGILSLQVELCPADIDIGYDPEETQSEVSTVPGDEEEEEGDDCQSP